MPSQRKETYFGIGGIKTEYNFRAYRRSREVKWGQNDKTIFGRLNINFLYIDVECDNDNSLYYNKL